MIIIFTWHDHFDGSLPIGPELSNANFRLKIRVCLKQFAWVQFILYCLRKQFRRMLLCVLRLLECSDLTQKVLADEALLLCFHKVTTRIVPVLLASLMHDASVTLDLVFNHGRLFDHMLSIWGDVWTIVLLVKGGDCQAKTLCLLWFSELQRLLKLALIKPAMTLVQGCI